MTVDPKLYRPNEVEVLQGDSSCARRVLGWKNQIGFNALVNEMVEEDLKIQRKNSSGHGSTQDSMA